MESKNELTPILFECCRLTKGAKQSIIVDLQRQAYRFIPNDLYDLLTETKGKTLYEIKKHYKNQFDEVINQYFQILENEELVFFTNQPSFFPSMSMKWDSASMITNAIIDITKSSKHPFSSIIHQLEELRCEHVQLRFFDEISLEHLESILNFFPKSSIYTIQIILPNITNVSLEHWVELAQSYSRVHSIILSSCSKSKLGYISPTKMGSIFYTEQKVNTESHCGIVHHELFQTDIKFFTESQNQNTCLNRKISIDKEGNIKNCPSMTVSFGNIKETTLPEALGHIGFKKYWNINKDQISVCRDCEFRHICTDCRAYLEDPEDIYSKPLKCGYNPYTCEWEEWSTNPLREKTIEYYNLRHSKK